MRMRPKSSSKDLPPRMLRRSRVLKSGKVWSSYYYNGRDDVGKRVEIPLGGDLAEAKRKWAELECKPIIDENTMMAIFHRYEREVVPLKAPRSQKDNLVQIEYLKRVFGSAPIDSITPQHIAQYRDQRKNPKTQEHAPYRANREIALFSHVFNMAREWGYTAQANPCRGVKRNKETPRSYYADANVWDLVIANATSELIDAMQLAYQTGQRPADVLKMKWSDIKDGALEVQQGKTGKRLRILLAEDGEPTGLGLVIEQIKSHKTTGFFIVSDKNGQPINQWTLRLRFDTARSAAAKSVEEDQPELAARIRAFQFRDIRPKAASETDLGHAQALLGHSKEQITRTVYRRLGSTVRSTT